MKFTNKYNFASKTDEVFDMIKQTETRECKYLSRIMDKRNPMNTNDLVFIYKELKNPEVSGQDWGNGPGTWDALEECKAQYPDADEFETFSVSNSNPWQPSVEGCVAHYYKNEQIRNLIVDILGMSTIELDSLPYGRESNLSAINFGLRYSYRNIPGEIRNRLKRKYIRGKRPLFSKELLEFLDTHPEILKELLDVKDPRPDTDGEDYFSQKDFEKWLTNNVSPFSKESIMKIYDGPQFQRELLIALFGDCRLDPLKTELSEIFM